MARTFIGELVLRLRDEMSGKARTAATSVDTSIDKMQRAARKLNQTGLGGQFEERLRKIGASSKDIDKLREAWNRLNASMRNRNLSQALASLERSNFKSSVLSQFSRISAGAKDADKSVRGLTIALKEMVKYGTAGTLIYGSIGAARGGIKANAEYQRELFREQNAGIAPADRALIFAEADRLTTKYPSAGLVNVLEMARSSTAMMGTTERGLAILEDMTKGLVALQTTKDPNIAGDQLRNLLRGIDNAGKNKDGELGLQDTRDIIAGMIRAAQVEGADLDVGKLFDFARRGKIAVPGLSTEFLANTAAAFMQDMKPDAFGTALSSAYQAFVIGSNAVASKKNIQRQEDIGIRNDNGLVDAKLFGTDPYAWVKKNLIPALQKSGVDMTDDTAVSQAVAELSRNTNATGLLTRMITQQSQIDRLLKQYKNAVGPDAADDALAKDPFVAWKGFVESWRELATSIKGMPEAVAGLNVLTSGLQRFSTALREKDGGAQALLAGAGVGAVFGTWKVTAAIWGLATAGTNLNAAALSLEAAAVSLGAGGAVGDIAGGKKGGWLSKVAPWLAALGSRVALPVGAVATTYNALNDIPHDGYASALKNNPNLMVDLENGRRRRQAFPGGFEGGRHAAGAGVGPQPGSYQGAVSEAQRAGDQIKSALDVTANPNINLAALHEADRLVKSIRAGLQGIGGAIQNAGSTVSNAMNRNFADYGVKP